MCAKNRVNFMTTNFHGNASPTIFQVELFLFSMDSPSQGDSSLSLPLSLSPYKSSYKDSLFLRCLLTENSQQHSLQRESPILSGDESVPIESFSLDFPINDSYTSIPFICGGPAPQLTLTISLPDT